MLCINRTPGESIIVLLPDKRTFRIICVKPHGKGAVIGLDAPPDIKFYRSEIYPPRVSEESSEQQIDRVPTLE